MDFFKELPQFVVKAGFTLSHLYGTDWENRLEVFVKILYFYILEYCLILHLSFFFYLYANLSEMLLMIFHSFYFY